MKSNLNNRVFDSVYGTFFSLYKYYKIYFIILFICLIAAYFYTSSPKTYNLVYDSKSSINSDTYDNIFNFHKILDFDPELLYHLEKQDVLDNELRTQILSKISTKIENHIRNLNEEKFVLLNDNCFCIIWLLVAQKLNFVYLIMNLNCVKLLNFI